MNSDKKITYISNWIKEYAISLPFTPPSLIIGVSGGIDSTVTSTLCAKTGRKTIVFHASRDNSIKKLLLCVN